MRFLVSRKQFHALSALSALLLLPAMAPALTATWDSATGELDISQEEATSVDLTVSAVGGEVRVADGGRDVTILNGPVDAADVTFIGVNCYAGDHADVVDARGVTAEAGFTNPSKQDPFVEVSLSSGADTFHGSAFSDSALGGNHDDTLRGYDGDDTLNGQSHNDYVDGGPGDDHLSNRASINVGNDTLIGGDGNDVFDVKEGANTIDAGPGDDTISGGTGNDTFYLGPGNDQLDVDPANMPGSSKRIYSTEGSDSVTGRKSDDAFFVTARNAGAVFINAGGQTDGDRLYYDLAQVGLLAHDLTITGDFNSETDRVFSASGLADLTVRWMDNEFIRPTAKMIGGSELEILLFSGGTTVTAQGGNVKIGGENPEGGPVAASSITTITVLASSDWRAPNFVDFSGVDPQDFTSLSRTFAALGYQDDLYVGGGAFDGFYDSPTKTNQDEESGDDTFANLGDGDAAQGYTGADRFIITDEVSAAAAIGVYGGWQDDALIYNHRGLAYDNAPEGETGGIVPNSGETRIRSVWYSDIEDKTAVTDLNAPPSWNGGDYSDSIARGSAWSLSFESPTDFSDSDGDAMALSIAGHQGQGDGAWLAFGTGAASATVSTDAAAAPGEHVFTLRVADSWGAFDETSLILTVTGDTDPPIVFDLDTTRPLSLGVMGTNGPRGVNMWGGWSYDLAHRTSLRGVAGGLDADSYDWRNLGSGIHGDSDQYRWTTLDYLRKVRDLEARPLFTANVLGFGDYSIIHEDAADMAALAADWVRYTNVIVPTYRQGDDLPSDVQALLDCLSWEGAETLTSPAESLPPKVLYWEIGNEPELDSVSGYIANHRLSATEYASRYRTIAQAMKAVDGGINVGPCIIYPSSTGGGYLAELLALPDAPVDFIAYHPYYSALLNAYDGGAGSPAAIQGALRGIHDHLKGEHDAVVSRLAAAGRPADTPQIASEWNDIHWYNEPRVMKSVAHGFGFAETVFTFADLGLLSANFWVNIRPHHIPLQILEQFQAWLQPVLVGVYRDGANLHVYVTGDEAGARYCVWVLNFSEDAEKTINLSLQGERPFIVDRVRRAVLRRNDGGDVGLKTENDPGLRNPVGWSAMEDLTGIVDPSGFILTYEDATITLLVFDGWTGTPSPGATEAQVWLCY